MLDINDIADRREKVMQVVRESFRPEFLNRLDDIVLFDAINENMLIQIIDVQLESMLFSIKEEKDITVTLSKTAREQILREGFNPIYGVRPLKRVIQTRILDLLAEAAPCRGGGIGRRARLKIVYRKM